MCRLIIPLLFIALFSACKKEEKMCSWYPMSNNNQVRYSRVATTLNYDHSTDSDKSIVTSLSTDNSETFGDYSFIQQTCGEVQLKIWDLPAQTLWKYDTTWRGGTFDVGGAKMYVEVKKDAGHKNDYYIHAVCIHGRNGMYIVVTFRPYVGIIRLDIREQSRTTIHYTRL